MAGVIQTTEATTSSSSSPSDGLMQQSVEKYADQGATPGFRELLKHGARARTTA